MKQEIVTRTERQCKKGREKNEEERKAMDETE